MNKPTLLAYMDLLATLFVFFLVLFAIVYADKKEAEKGNIEFKAEFLVTMDWKDMSENDFDLWVRGPDNKLVFFNSKETDSITLDRDDLGNGGADYPVRREIVSIRGNNPGEYVVNVVFWNKKGENEDVKVSIFKLNPYEVLTEKTLAFDRIKQEKTVLRFIIDNKGKVLSKNSSELLMAQDIIRQMATGGTP